MQDFAHKKTPRSWEILYLKAVKKPPAVCLRRRGFMHTDLGFLAKPALKSSGMPFSVNHSS